MSRSCATCSDPRLADIDGLLAAGRSARSLAIEFGLPPDSVKRHARNHLARGTVEPRQPGADPLDELVAALRTRALSGDPAAAREYRLSMSAQAANRAAPAAPDLVESSEWIDLRTAILGALAAFPEARQAVADAIGER